jgi:hypothetical protein
MTSVDKSSYHYNDGLSEKLDHVDSSSYLINNVNNYDNDVKSIFSSSKIFNSFPNNSIFSSSEKELASEGMMQNLLTSRAHIRNYTPGQIIFEQGSEIHLLYIIILGECAHIRKLNFLHSRHPNTSAYCEKFDISGTSVEVLFLL